MGRTKGSRNPERIRTPALESAQELLRTLNAEELPLVRTWFLQGRSEALSRLVALAGQMDEEERQVTFGLAVHRLAVLNDRCDEPERRGADRRNRCSEALHEVDLTLRETEKRPLREVKDYRRLRPSWAPALSTIYNEYGNWHTALRESGVLYLARPEAELVRRDGRPKGGRPKPTLEEKVQAIALVMDRCFRGRRFKHQAYDEARERFEQSLPSYSSLVGKSQTRDRKRTWDEMLDLAVDLILALPEEYPTAHRYISRCRAARPSSSPGRDDA